MEKAEFGVVGLGVMGRNLALNIANKGYSVAVYNRTKSKIIDLLESAKGKPIQGAFSYESFVEMLERPRKILLMVKAGPIVDVVIEDIKPFLEEGDILIDGGNSYFKDTERRTESLNSEGLLFIGTGVSGGEEGALKGPSIMPGGNRSAWEAVKAILVAAAAKAEDGQACVDYIGPRGAGHYVKMVHNGIEYADMQLIAEIYDLLHRGLGLSYLELGDLFTDWSEGHLSSFLIDITADIFMTKDPETGHPILDVILDEANQKGTGRWTSQNALDLGVPVSTINAAVVSRIISGMKDQRVAACEKIKGPIPNFKEDERRQLIEAAEHALYAAKIISYAQGFGMLQAASKEYDYGLDMKMIAKIWRAGCIIQADLLDEIMSAYDRNPNLSNLLMDDYFREQVVIRQGALRYVLINAIQMGIPVYALSSALGYFDAFRTARLPANLTEAQRDYFGAHTYRRLDKAGSYHTDWQA